MSIEQTDVIDFIGVNDSENEVVLTISDHLEWESSNTQDHLSLLQDKINSYLSFIEGGQLLESYPDSEGKKPVISIVGQYSLNDEAESFINQVKSIVSDAGMSLRFEVYKEA